jgi:hypothetical protein
MKQKKTKQTKKKRAATQAEQWQKLYELMAKKLNQTK